MAEKGKRFADEEKNSADVENTERQEEKPEEAERDDKDKRLKEKNSKKLEKLMKKQKRREKHSHREVLTYEDMPLEEREDEEDAPPKKKLQYKKIIAAAVIVILLFSIVFFAFNSDRFSFHNISNFFNYGLLNRQSEERFPLDIKGESVSAGNFKRIGQDICYSSDTKTRLLNNYGRTVYSAQHAFIDPVLTVGKKGSLIYNLGGAGYQLIDKEGSVYSGEANDSILSADYADNGVYAFITESAGYLSKLYVYDEDHEQIFAYSFADYYATSVSLNSSGSRAVVSGVSALNGVEISSVYVLDFTKDTPLIFKELGNDFIYDVEYLSDKYACAVGRSASYVINTYNEDVVTNDYDGRSLTAYDINTDTATYTLSLSGSGDGRNCDIVSYGTSGSLDKSFTVDKKIISVSSYKGRVALLSGDSVMLFSKDGKVFSETALSSDPHSVVLYTSSDAYVLCTGYIDSVSM